MINSSIIRKKSSIFIIIKGFFIFGLIWLLSLVLYGLINFESYYSSIIYLINFYITYFIGYFVFKNVIGSSDCNDVDRVKYLSLILFFIYYIIVFPRYYLLEGKHDLYGFRLIFGFIYPIWILTPIFITNPKSKFYVYLCILLCTLEVIFWILFFKMSGSEFYKRPSFVSVLISSFIFALTFPWYLSWLRKIDIKKWTFPFFFKENSFISKLISWVAIGFGSFFMFLFFFFF
ncbi:MULTISPECIES: hypothetical protein [Acinetobacter]|jgi:hypothetical protein|uniref:hypothetical protein n=1 Tax=Acinetobacter TaxID=469 RepID=UPI000453AF7F|nr:putative membrane protein [Acinetobacter sp. 1245593]EXR28534.1 putative membrane protein [Acinetobacter sp. 1281984]OIC72641.1 hypothetical protein A7L14_09720 [Acinetobacter nosocomialis]SSR41269.1 Uncharacterised protein [Acinetobacter baumannii]OID34276.1 hypothetical protein A7L09_03845 [Acinetobacter nosocomialis]